MTLMTLSDRGARCDAYSKSARGVVDRAAFAFSAGSVTTLDRVEGFTDQQKYL